MWESVFDNMLERLIFDGRLSVKFPDGKIRKYGGGNGESAAVAIADTATIRRLCLRPELALGEAYMNGTLTIENDDIDGLVRLVLRNQGTGSFPAWVRFLDRMRYTLRGWLQRNTVRTARQNVAHHYDLSDDLYRLFLDQDMQYSCAYFQQPGMTLEQAQIAKKSHIATKLRIEPGMRVLDIGCGWGGMALTLASEYDARVTGITLSKNQLATARHRARAQGLEQATDFRLMDYRLLNEKFDRIVSVGMLEHVGAPHFPEYFGKVSDLLEEDGVALIHTIGRTGPPHAQAQWINKYIFPGGYVPALSELAPAIENSGLWNLDTEILRLHYAMTLRQWLDRFDARIDDVRNMYDDRFIRMWRYYLIICALAFEEQHQAVFQFQLGHRRDAVPLTRGYLYDPERQSHRREAAE